MPTIEEHASELSWALVIPTYQRRDVLLHCLACAVQQTLLPKEIIVVDASPDWYQTYQHVLSTLVAQQPDIQWHYLRAEHISSATQRNQGIRYATADVVFLIDDDSFLYPDCAAQVMQVYAADTAQQVAGVMPMLMSLPSSSPAHSSILSKQRTSAKLATVLNSKLRAFAKRLLKDDDIFIPYDFAFPQYQLPAELEHLAVHTVALMHGARMTFRRDILHTIQFEETLERYAVNEDNDVCYRASHQGMLLQALDARIYHLQSRQARLSRFTTTTLWGWNQALLHRLHSADLPRFRKQFTRLIWRRLLTQTVKDLVELRWTFPSTRGIFCALWYLHEILNCPIEQLREWYPSFQQALIQREQRGVKANRTWLSFSDTHYQRSYRKIPSSDP